MCYSVCKVHALNQHMAGKCVTLSPEMMNVITIKLCIVVKLTVLLQYYGCSMILAYFIDTVILPCV